MAFCDDITTNLEPSCEAIKKPAGLDKRIWIGLLKDVTAFANGTGNQITAITFASMKGLITATGKKEKNNSSMSLNVGANYSLRTHSFNFIGYYFDAADLAAIDALIDQEQVFVCTETNAGTIEVYGVNLGSNYNNFGLNVSALEGGSGTAMIDESQYGLTFSGDHENLQLIFNDTAAMTPGLAADIAYLDALVVGV